MQQENCGPNERGALDNWCAGLVSQGEIAVLKRILDEGIIKVMSFDEIRSKI
jgi:hypothetical protein